MVNFIPMIDLDFIGAILFQIMICYQFFGGLRRFLKGLTIQSIVSRCINANQDLNHDTKYNNKEFKKEFKIKNTSPTLNSPIASLVFVSLAIDVAKLLSRWKPLASK